MRFTRERLRLVSNSEINQISFGFLGDWRNWSSCCWVRIDRRLLVLLKFDHCTLLTHLRFQLLQPLRKFLHCGFNNAPPPCADVRQGGTFS